MRISYIAVASLNRRVQLGLWLPVLSGAPSAKESRRRSSSKSIATCYSPEPVQRGILFGMNNTTAIDCFNRQGYSKAETLLSLLAGDFSRDLRSFLKLFALFLQERRILGRTPCLAPNPRLCMPAPFRDIPLVRIPLGHSSGGSLRFSRQG